MTRRPGSPARTCNATLAGRASVGSSSNQCQSPRRLSLAVRRDWLPALLFLTPNIVSIGLFTLLPVVAGFFLSFTSWDMLSDPVWIGFDNYLKLISDRQFWNSLGNTVIYTMIVIPGGLALSLALALALNSKIKGTAFYQAVFFLPYVSSTVAVALVWKWIYHPDYGVLNAILKAVGLPGVNWLTDPKIALLSVAMVQIWQTAGYNMVLFLAGLRSIPRNITRRRGSMARRRGRPSGRSPCRC